MLAVSGYMRPDPYSGAPGVEEVAPGVYRVTVRLASPRGDKRITFTLRLGETFEQSRLVFSPLLNRFLAGEDSETRPVKISDSGRIRNELQTLCSEALEFVDSPDDPRPLRPHPARGDLARAAAEAAGGAALVQDAPPDVVRVDGGGGAEGRSAGLKTAYGSGLKARLGSRQGQRPGRLV